MVAAKGGDISSMVGCRCGWWLIACLATSTFSTVSQAQSYVDSQPGMYPSKFKCPAGYVDKTGGKPKYWKCGIGCPGGAFSDDDCHCACVLPSELHRSSSARAATTTTNPTAVTTPAQDGAKDTTSFAGAAGKPAAPESISNQISASTASSTAGGTGANDGSISSSSSSGGGSGSVSSNGSGRGSSNVAASTAEVDKTRVFLTVLTTLPPVSSSKKLRGAKEREDTKGGLSPLVIFIIIISALVIVGTFSLVAIVHYIGIKHSKHTSQVTPVINKTNLAVKPSPPPHDKLSRPRNAWEVSTLATLQLQDSPCASDVSTRQPSPLPSDRSIFSTPSSTANSATTIAASTPPRDAICGMHKMTMHGAQPVDFASWQQTTYPRQPQSHNKQRSGGDCKTAVGSEQQPVQSNSQQHQPRSTKAQHHRQRSSRRSDVRSSQYSDLRNAQRIDLQSVQVSPPSVRNVCLAKPGQPPAALDNTNVKDPNLGPHADHCNSPDRNLHMPVQDAMIAPPWRDVFKGETSDSAGPGSESGSS